MTIDNYAEVKSVCLYKNFKDEHIDVSILIPTYKRATYLEEALNSIKSQEKCNFNVEVIVINNDPASDMSDVIEHFKELKNIAFYQNERNIGMIGNMNRCAELAHGYYLAYLHDDDLLHNNYLCSIEKALKEIKDDNCAAYVVNRDIIGKNPTGINEYVKNVLKGVARLLFLFRFAYRKKYELLTPEKVLLSWNKNYYLAPTCGTLFVKKKFLEIGGWNEDYYPVFDAILFLQLNQRYKIYFIREKLGVYRWDVNASLNADVRISTCCYRLRLINYNYSSKKLSSFFFSNRDVLSYLELNKYKNNEINEILHKVNIEYKKPTICQIAVFKIKNFSYRLINNIDY